VAKYVIKARESCVRDALVSRGLGRLDSDLGAHVEPIGKNRTWSTAMLLATAVYATSYYYHEGTWQLWIVLAAIVGAANGCTMTLGPSISADVIDSDELEPAAGAKARSWGSGPSWTRPPSASRSSSDAGARGGRLRAESGSERDGGVRDQVPLLHRAGGLPPRGRDRLPALPDHGRGPCGHPRAARCAGDARASEQLAAGTHVPRPEPRAARSILHRHR